MGLALARRKRATPGQMRPAAGPIPGSAIRPRLINPAGFDKAKPQAVDDSMGIRGPDSRLTRPLTGFSQQSASQTASVFNSIGTSLSKLRVARQLLQIGKTNSQNKKKPGCDSRAF
jgi:hypothetical protein